MKFINKTLNQNFKEEEIEKYNSSFINNMFKNQEADVVYKIKDKNIFILIEHQTKIDYSMPYRILQYEVAIIKSALDVKKIKNKSYKLPLVIPIVLYIGKQKWNANKYLEESQEKLEGFKRSLSYYNIVDVNDFTEKELLEDGTLLSKMMLVETAKDSNELVKLLDEIIITINEEQKELMIKIISMIFSHKIGKENANRLINKIKGGNKNMSRVIEMLIKENQMYINKGRKENQISITKRMLKKNMPIELIAEITELSIKKVEDIQKTIKK